MGIQVDFKKQRWFVIWLIILSIMGLLVLNIAIPVIFIMCGVIEILNSIATPSFGYLILYMLVYVLQFFFASLALSERFKLINNYLR